MSGMTYPSNENIKEIKGKTAADIIYKMLAEENTTQNQLAKELGMTRQNVSRILAGRMRYETFAKIVKAFGYEIKIEKRSCENKMYK